MTGHHQIPSKINLGSSPHGLIELTIEWSLITDYWCHGYRDHRGLSKQSPWKY